MQYHIEPASGGLVTSKDPSTLAQGELQNGDNFIYLPDVDSAWRAPGVTKWGTVAASGEGVNGITSCRFSNGTHYLVAQASGKLWSANAETDASSFASATINTSGLATAADHLWSTQFDDRHYIFNGIDDTRVLLPDGTTRQHGLLPVSQKLTYIGTLASAFSETATGYYEYWYTEVVEFADGQELESTFDGKPLTIYVSSTTTCPEIEMPSTFVNKAAGGVKAYFNLYRSEVKLNINDELYPIGRKIAQSTNVDTSGATIKVRVPDTSATSNTGVKTSAAADNKAAGTGVTVSANTFSTTFTRNAVATTLPAQNAGVIFIHNFSPGTFSGNIIGLSVNVTASASTADIADIYVAPVHRLSNTPGAIQHSAIPASGGQPAFYPGFCKLVPTGGVIAASDLAVGTKASQRRTVNNTGSTVYSFGGATDDWLPTEYAWKVQDFDSNFGFQVMVLFNNKAVNGNTVTLTGLDVNIYYVGTSSTTKLDRKVYDAVVVEEDGVVLKYGANGKPPKASCAAVFEGCLVTNDIDEPGKIVWSVPGKPDYFPTTVYWMLMPAEDLEDITYLGVVNNRLVVGTGNSLYRVNYLPNETDASFSRGRAVERISNTVGIIKPTCGTPMTTAAGQQALAFADTNGIFATNGYTITKLSSDLCWNGASSRNPVFGMSLSSNINAVVVGLYNDPYTQTLRFILQGGQMYAGSYAARHMKEGGGLKWSKINAIWYDDSNFSFQPTGAAAFRRNTGAWVFVYSYNKSLVNLGTDGGIVARQNGIDSATYTVLRGSNNPSFIQTRDMYLAGIGNEIEIQSIILHGKDYGTANSNLTIAADLTITQQYTNAASNATTVLTMPAGVSTCVLAETGVGSINADAFSVKVQPTTTGMWRIESIVCGGQGWGESEDRA